MTKVNIMYDLEPDYYPNELTHEPTITMHGHKNKSVRVSDRVFDVMLSEGLLQKTDDGYVFVGHADDLPQKPKKKKRQL